MNRHNRETAGDATGPIVGRCTCVPQQSWPAPQEFCWSNTTARMIGRFRVGEWSRLKTPAGVQFLKWPKKRESSSPTRFTWGGMQEPSLPMKSSWPTGRAHPAPIGGNFRTRSGGI